MITKSVSIGPNYRKVTVSCRGLKASPYVPGQCISVNDHMMALTAARDGEFEAVVPSRRNYLDDRPIKEFVFPTGAGFSGVDVPVAYIVSGGCAFGAFADFVTRRAASGLETHVLLVGRNIKLADVTAVFPAFGAVDTQCWDTTDRGRPGVTDLLPSDFSKQEGVGVFFAGPRSLFELLKTSHHKPIVRLNH